MIGMTITWSFNMINILNRLELQMVKWICPDCGHVHEGDEPPTEDCPICGAPAEDYEKE